MGLISTSNVLCTKDVCIALVLVLAAPLLYKLWLAVVVSAWWTPLRIKRAFESQGIPCLPFRCFHGNLPEIMSLNKEARCLPMPNVSHDITPRILPYFHHWSKRYGDQYVYWFGSEARFNIVNVEDVKEILSRNFRVYPKRKWRPDAVDMFGNGLVSLFGEKWAHHRTILNPAFFLEKLNKWNLYSIDSLKLTQWTLKYQNAMIPTKVACTTALVDKWGSLIEEGQAIDVHKEFKELSADVIAHTAFGSSFAEAKQVFELQTQQQILMHKILHSVFIPGARFLPTAFNWLRWRIKRDIKRGLRQVINNRLKSIEVGGGDLYGNDLLGVMMAANRAEALVGGQKKLTMSVDDIIDECKTFFFAGYDTTATLLTWTLLWKCVKPPSTHVCSHNVYYLQLILHGRSTHGRRCRPYVA